MKFHWPLISHVPVLSGLCLTLATAPAVAAAGLRAGTAKVDISPTQFPVLVNAMFTERTASRVVDPLMVRALVLKTAERASPSRSWTPA